MTTTKASRKAKRESHGKGHDSDNSSAILKTRKVHDSKEAITKGAVKKSDQKARQTREYVLKNRDKPIAQNGRQPGRQLIRWNVCTDQILLLIMEYELKRHGVVIPWDAIAKRLASEKDTTGPCVQQHLTKLRKEMFARGSWVPPLSGKPNSKQQQPDVRGYVMVKKRNGETETREVSWTEDAFKYVDLVHINKANMFKVNKSANHGEVTPGPARHVANTKWSGKEQSGDEMDPADLPSDEEFDPSNKKAKVVKRITRASAKFGGHSNGGSYDSDSDADSESEYGSIVKREGSNKPVMMALYQSDEEGEAFNGIVILSIAQHWLAEYPQGINEAYRNTHGILIGKTDEDGEEVFGEDESNLGSHHPANTAYNYAQAFAHGVGYSVMDANTQENYEAAFGSDEEYSIMDANTDQNYVAAFGGVNEASFGRFHADNYGLDNSDSDQDFDGQRVNATMGNFESHMIHQPNQMNRFGNASRESNVFGPALQNSQYNQASVFNQVHNQQVGQGNLIEVSTSASIPVRNGSFQTSNNQNATGQYNMWEDDSGQNDFYSDARSHNLMTGGPVNGAATGDSYDGKTFAQIITERNALSCGSGIGLGHGSSISNGFVVGGTTNTANDPFVSNEGSFTNQMVDVQTETGSNTQIPTIAVNDNPIDQDDTNVFMDGNGINSGNDENGTPEYSGTQFPFQDSMASFDQYFDFDPNFGYGY